MLVLITIFLLLLVLLVGVIYYYFDVLFKSEPEEKEEKKKEKVPVSTLHRKDHEVFHVADRKFNYEEAKDVCKQYGARLANYDELAHHYQHGGEFCNYGWSDNQLALYPTQKTTWDKLQKSYPEYRNMCGHYGINGGKFPKHMKFGANCYGTRPSKPDDEFVYPVIPEMKKPENVPKYFKNTIVAPFNRNQWERNAGNPLLQSHHTFSK